MYADTAADFNDDVLAELTARPGQTARKIAKRLRADHSTVLRALAFLVKDHYAVLIRDGRKETYDPAA